MGHPQALIESNDKYIEVIILLMINVNSEDPEQLSSRAVRIGKWSNGSIVIWVV